MTEEPEAIVFGTEKERTTFVYRDFVDMLDARNETYPQFNDRRLLEFVDDSRKRVNSYAPGKKEYDPPKEDWQANSFNPITRNKLKAIAASVSTLIPESKIVAVNKKNQIDLEAAELLRGLKRFSHLNENIALTHTMDVWNMLSDGTVITYEGYLKTKKKIRVVKTYNQVEGEAEVEEEEVIVDDKCITVPVPIDQFYIKDFSIFDIQSQPSVAWVRYLSEGELKAEYSHCKNYKKVLDNNRKQKSEATGSGFSDEEKSFYNNRWLARAKGKREYEVIQHYDNDNDTYRVVCNGLMFSDTPLLLGKKNKKYPFAKGISEMFAGGDFFYGNAFGAILQFGQDTQNTFWNMMIDKTLRSFAKPQVVGADNQDAFENADDGYDWNSRIFVNNVDQWKELDISGINQSELAMFDKVSEQIDLASVDRTQQGISGQQQGITATEIRTANANARKAKGIFFTFLEDFHLQKDKLRIMNILTNYTVPKVEAINEKGAEYKTFAFPDEMKDGEAGIKEIQFVENREQVPSQSAQNAEMEKREKNGTYTEIEIYPSNYLDNYLFDIAIVSESLHIKDKAENIADTTELLQLLTVFFPEFFQANKNDFLKRKVLPAYGESMENFQLPNPMQQQMPQEGQQPNQNPALPAAIDSLKLNK